MILKQYLFEQGLTLEAFGALIDVDLSRGSRHANGRRIPRPVIMRRTAEATDGQVGPQDFYGQGIGGRRAGRAPFRVTLSDDLQQHDLTAARLAERIGMAPTAIRDDVRGKRHPRPAIMRRIVVAGDGAAGPTNFLEKAS